MPTPIANFDGIPNVFGPLPPDTNGDVGRNQYVQTVNSTFQVWSKTGVSQYGPVNINTLWIGLGGSCESNNDGDPITLYDPWPADGLSASLPTTATSASLFQPAKMLQARITGTISSQATIRPYRGLPALRRLA